MRSGDRAVTGQLGPIDVLINNAGSLMQRMRILEVKEESWDEIQDLNLKSAVLGDKLNTYGWVWLGVGVLLSVEDLRLVAGLFDRA